MTLLQTSTSHVQWGTVRFTYLTCSLIALWPDCDNHGQIWNCNIVYINTELKYTFKILLEHWCVCVSACCRRVSWLGATVEGEFLSSLHTLAQRIVWWEKIKNWHSNYRKNNVSLLFNVTLTYISTNSNASSHISFLGNNRVPSFTSVSSNDSLNTETPSRTLGVPKSQKGINSSNVSTQKLATILGPSIFSMK